MSVHNIYEDGKIRVMHEQCDTCIFRPGNRMELAPGRVAGMVKECLDDQTVIPCHKTIHNDDTKQAVCRGLYERYGDRILPLALGKSMGVIEDYDRSATKKLEKNS